MILLAACLLGFQDLPPSFESRVVEDRRQRQIRYYVADAPETSRPLVVFIQGSGADSVFTLRPSGVALAYGASAVHAACRDKARFLMVEKVGLEYAKSETLPGNPTFRREHTLDRWADAIADVIEKESHNQPVLVVGHSEGGLVAARVARTSMRVTHAASVSGGGPNFLQDLLWLGRKGYFKGAKSPSPEDQEAYVRQAVADIQAHPSNPEKIFFGHAYPRWSALLATSPKDEFLKASVPVYIAQGTADDVIDPAGVDAMVEELKKAGKKVTYDRVEAADHSFRTPAKDDWFPLYQRIIAWFTKERDT